jgi:hypothetical protein
VTTSEYLLLYVFDFYPLFFGDFLLVTAFGIDMSTNRANDFPDHLPGPILQALRFPGSFNSC